MKRKYILLPLAAFALLFSSCAKEVESTNKASTESLENLDGVQQKVVGLYASYRSAASAGRSIQAIGDIAGNTATYSQDGEYYKELYNYAVQPTNGDLGDLWSAIYGCLDMSVRANVTADHLLSKTKDEDEIKELYLYKGQAYGLKAFGEFILLNVFARTYKGHENEPGIPLLPESQTQAPFVQTKRSTVEEGYKAVLDNLDKAIECFDKVEGLLKPNVGLGMSSAFYFTKGAALALKTRVLLYMEKWDEAIAAGEAAATELGLDFSKASLNGEDYVKMWSVLNINPAEHIFLLAVTEQENLSANSLNNLWGTYAVVLEEGIAALFADTDVRKQLLGLNADLTIPGAQQSLKWRGVNGPSAVSNIPLLRVSELALNLAEAKLKAGDMAKAKEYLFFTAQRNSAITGVDALPATEDELMKFIEDERIRELLAEGFNFYDLRRWGKEKTVPGVGTYRMGEFAYPIPSGEVNAVGGAEQSPTSWWQPAQ